MIQGNAYPHITDEMLIPVLAIRKMALQNPSYLDDPWCPYPLKVKDTLRQILYLSSPKNYDRDEAAAEVEEMGDEELMRSMVRTAITELYAQQKTINKEKTKEILDSHKVIAGLIEKFIDLKERQMKIDEVFVFQTQILRILDNVMTPDQRTIVMEQLGRFLSDGVK